MELMERQWPSSADSFPRGLEDAPRPLPEPADLEGRYRAARTRLLAAQQEKMEAAAQFLAARAELRLHLEEVWPGEAAGQEEWFDAEMAAGV